MSDPIDPQRLAIAREYARARRSDRLAATLTGLLSEVLADRDRLAAEAAAQPSGAAPMIAHLRGLARELDFYGSPSHDGHYFLILEIPDGTIVNTDTVKIEAGS